MTLDSIDMTILKELQQDARVTTVELARRINLSPTPCANRIRRLQREGYIIGFHARLNPARLGRALLVFVNVKLRNTDERALAAFNRAMARLPEVLECHMVGGGFDYLIKLRVHDMKEYRAFLGQVIGAMESVENTHSYFVMEEVKETPLLPLDAGNLTHGSVDG